MRGEVEVFVARGGGEPLGCPEGGGASGTTRVFAVGVYPTVKAEHHDAILLLQVRPEKAPSNTRLPSSTFSTTLGDDRRSCFPSGGNRLQGSLRRDLSTCNRKTGVPEPRRTVESGRG